MFTWVGLSSKSPVLRDKWADHLVHLQTYHLGSEWDHRMPGYHALADLQPSAWVVVGHDHWSAPIADDVWYPNADVGDKHVYSCGSSLVSTPPLRPSPSWIAETFQQVEVGRPEVLPTQPGAMPDSKPFRESCHTGCSRSSPSGTASGRRPLLICIMNGIAQLLTCWILY